MGNASFGVGSDLHGRKTTINRMSFKQSLSSWSRRALATFLVIGIVIPSVPVANAAKGISGSPRVINLYLDWQLKEEDLPALARWDIIVLDADQQARYPARVRKIRELNPAIKILAYLPSEEIANARFSEPPEYPFAKLANQIQENWYLKDPAGQKAYFWPGSALLNVTDKGPVGANGKRWNEFLGVFIREEIMSSGLWDGVFLDNTFDGISHFAKGPIDLDRDGRADDPATADASWREGMRKLLRVIREQNPNAIMMGNGGAYYADHLHGAFFERFPSWSWGPNWKEFRDTISRNRAPSYTSLNVNTDNQERPNDYRLMRYGLGSALVGGGAYSFDMGDYNHNRLWWYDEYEVPLGSPRADAQILGGATGGGTSPAVWARSFDRGMVLVNSTSKVQRVALPGIYEKIRGKQDAKTNDGAVVSSIEIPANDGIILLRKSEAAQVKGGAVVNGSFVRPYDARGRQVQSGFFSSRDDAANGATVLSSDLNRDGADEFIKAESGTVRVRDGKSGKVNSFVPFRGFTGRLSVAVGNANRDDALELVFARESAGFSPAVRVMTATGGLIAEWLAYAEGFRGGVRVGIGDINADGLREIVTGAGGGGGPHVRIWKTDGKTWSNGFFAFDKTERGGVSIAVADVDNDGTSEIVTGSGLGAIPRVRVYHANGTLKTEFTLGSRPLVGGIQVYVADIDGGSTPEILVSGLPIF
jgi:hypothetical protein